MHCFIFGSDPAHQTCMHVNGNAAKRILPVVAWKEKPQPSICISGSVCVWLTGSVISAQSNKYEGRWAHGIKTVEQEAAI